MQQTHCLYCPALTAAGTAATVVVVYTLRLDAAENSIQWLLITQQDRFTCKRPMPGHLNVSCCSRTLTGALAPSAANCNASTAESSAITLLHTLVLQTLLAAGLARLIQEHHHHHTPVWQLIDHCLHAGCDESSCSQGDT
jgi:hypothetical protein